MKKYKLLNHIVTHFFEFCFQGFLFSIQLCIQKFILEHHLPNGRSLCSQANSCLNNHPNSTWMITIPLGDRTVHYWSTRGLWGNSASRKFVRISPTPYHITVRLKMEHITKHVWSTPWPQRVTTISFRYDHKL